MKRFMTSLDRRTNSISGGVNVSATPTYEESSPEAVILREVTAFCEAGGSANNSQSTDYIHLPAIVEAAESSPNAAKEAAYRLRKLMSNPSSTSGRVHYNAIVLMRILIDNPGHTFTRNLDAKFASTIKDLLRQGMDLDVQQFLRETMEWMETDRSWDEDLATMLQMWKKEKDRYQKVHKSLNSRPRPPIRGLSQNFYGSPSAASRRPANVGSSSTLPPPEELSARISEAKNSANLLVQFVQSTPPAEILDNELMREFSQRCQNASSAMQTYVHAKNPAPDEDTLLTLIETNEELSVALSKHQRAILNARKTLGRSNSQTPADSDEAAEESSSSRPVPAPPVSQSHEQGQSSSSSAVPSPPTASPPLGAGAGAGAVSGSGVPSNSSPPGRYEYRSEDFQVQNPFAEGAHEIPDTSATATSNGNAQQAHSTSQVNERWYRQHAEGAS